MPHGPPSPAVSMTETGVCSAPAISFWPTPFALKKPPWPSSESTAACSCSIRMSMPIFSVAIAE